VLEGEAAAEHVLHGEVVAHTCRRGDHNTVGGARLDGGGLGTGDGQKEAGPGGPPKARRRRRGVQVVAAGWRAVDLKLASVGWGQARAHEGLSP
jgi:hypothetical protein